MAKKPTSAKADPAQSKSAPEPITSGTKKSSGSKPTPAPTMSGFAWKRLLTWPYLTGAGVAVAAIIIGLVLAGQPPAVNPPLVTANSSTNAAAVSPAVPDLVGGVTAHGHYYPVAVMIDNHSAARPQSGLQAASVVYEALVEGGITRFMAVYDHGKVEQIGPVRSARPYFLQWLAEYDAAYAHAGGSPEALGDIRKERVHDINGIGSAAGAFHRDGTRPAPHNLYTSSEKLYTVTVQNKLKISDVDIVSWTFGSILPPGGTAAKTVDMFFTGKTKSTQVTYTYDAAKQQWLRNQAGQPHQDRLTKAQIGTTNLIVQRIPSSIGVGEKGRLTMTVTGTGSAKLFQQGMVREVTWTKKDREARTMFTNADGTPVTFLPGNTWIEVLPSDRTLTVQ